MSTHNPIPSPLFDGLQQMLKKYEFGTKVSIAKAKDSHLIVIEAYRSTIGFDITILD